MRYPGHLRGVNCGQLSFDLFQQHDLLVATCTFGGRQLTLGRVGQTPQIFHELIIVDRLSSSSSIQSRRHLSLLLGLAGGVAEREILSDVLRGHTKRFVIERIVGFVQLVTETVVRILELIHLLLAALRTVGVKAKEGHDC